MGHGLYNTSMNTNSRKILEKLLEFISPAKKCQ